MVIQLVQSLIDQCHLCPLTPLVLPTLPEFEGALRLYPMPTTVWAHSLSLKTIYPELDAQLVLADKYERYELTYEGCHVFNPGSFLGTSYGFSTYYPATGKSEPS